MCILAHYTNTPKILNKKDCQKKGEQNQKQQFIFVFTCYSTIYYLKYQFHPVLLLPIHFQTIKSTCTVYPLVNKHMLHVTFSTTQNKFL